MSSECDEKMLAARVAAARHRHVHQEHCPLELQVRRLLPFVTIGCVLGVITSVYIIPLLLSIPTSVPSSHEPSYTRQPEHHSSCTRPVLQNAHEFAGSVTCMQLKSSSSTTIELELTPTSVGGHILTATLSTRTTAPDLTSKQTFVHSASLSLTNHTSTIFVYSASRLHPCTEYGLIVESLHHTHPKRQLICSGQIATKCDPPNGNLLQNPSFEQAGDSPFIATRRDLNAQKDLNPRQWTPFYDGGARRICGVTPLSANEPDVNHTLSPRSGNCAIALGKLPHIWTLSSFQKHSHYGMHTAVALNDVNNGNNDNVLLVQGWFARWNEGVEDETIGEAKLVLSWTLHDGTVSDGIFIPLLSRHKSNEWMWQPVCVQISNAKHIRIVHIFFHLDANDTHSGPGVVPDGDILGIDDVTVSWNRENDTHYDRLFDRVCYKASATAHGKQSHAIQNENRKRDPPVVHLQASEIPPYDSLTLAVPLTADRALRLETLSRAYGGGGIAAAVVVNDEMEMGQFVSIWAHKAWLHRHVNVTFIRRYNEDDVSGHKKSVLGINLIRNIAVSLARTQYVAMLDVDMIPATKEFECLRRDASVSLRGVLPKGRKNVLAMAVLLPDIHVRQVQNKEEARDGLLSHSLFFYCVASQRGTKIRQWFGTERSNVRMSRFLADYEPYVVARRDEYPAYDERFVGYGFNKIAWLMQAQAAGWKTVVTSDLFVSHLNHVEMDWVTGIRQDVYVQTWRRFMALAAEVGEIAFGGRHGAISTEVTLL